MACTVHQLNLEIHVVLDGMNLWLICSPREELLRVVPSCSTISKLFGWRRGTMALLAAAIFFSRRATQPSFVFVFALDLLGNRNNFAGAPWT